MRLGGSCDACAAKDSEITYLREQNKALTDKVLAVVDPALEARRAQALRMAQAPAPGNPPRPPARMSPADIRRMRRDGPTPMQQQAARAAASQRAAETEASFSKSRE